MWLWFRDVLARNRKPLNILAQPKQFSIPNTERLSGRIGVLSSGFHFCPLRIRQGLYLGIASAVCALAHTQANDRPKESGANQISKRSCFPEGNDFADAQGSPSSNSPVIGLVVM